MNNNSKQGLNAQCGIFEFHENATNLQAEKIPF